MIEPHKTYYTYDQIHRGAYILVHKINKSDFSPDLIIGIARGGLVPATLLAQTFKVPIVSINYSSKKGKGNDKHHIDDRRTVDEYIVNMYVRDIERKALNILIVDDVVDSGETMTDMVKSMAAGRAMRDTVKTATLFYRNLSTSPTTMKPDYYWTELTDPHWIIFPWEILTDD